MPITKFPVPFFNRSELDALPLSTTNIRPRVQVADSGSPSLGAMCELNIRLFDFDSTVFVTIRGNPDTNVTFERLLEEFFTLDIVIADLIPINATHYTIQTYGKNMTVVISADDLVKMIGNLTIAQMDILRQAGITIIDVVSNTPTDPPMTVPRPTIPAWAVVVIVILNSVIIIAVLIIILILLLRSLRE